MGSLGSGAGATGLGSSSAVRLGTGTSAVVGSGESVLAIFGCDGFGSVDGGSDGEVEVEVAMADYLQPSSFSSTRFTLSSTSGKE